MQQVKTFEIRMPSNLRVAAEIGKALGAVALVVALAALVGYGLWTNPGVGVAIGLVSACLAVKARTLVLAGIACAALAAAILAMKYGGAVALYVFVCGLVAERAVSAARSFKTSASAVVCAEPKEEVLYDDDSPRVPLDGI